MGMFAGLIAGAMGGGAQAVGQIADNQIQKQTRMDLSSFESQLQMDRAAQLARLQQMMAREDQTYNTTGPGADEKLKFAGKETDVLVDRETKTGKARGAVERANMGAYSLDADARAGVRAKAKDQHVEGAAGAASAEKTRYELEQMRSLRKMMDEYDNPATKPDRRTELERTLTLRGAFKPLESNTQTVVEETPTAEGGTRKVTRTEKAPGPAKVESLAPTPIDIDYLKANPGKSAGFDMRFGAGAAERVLGKQAPAPSSDMALMRDQDVRQIASVPGHARQQQAKDELAARQRRRIDERNESVRRSNDAGAGGEFN